MVHSSKKGLILGVAVLSYFASVIQRSTMGVASLTAISRFDVGAAALSALAVSQLAVYAAMQIPAGMLLDKYGSRRLIVFGSMMTGIGNALVAFAPNFSLAVIGRMVVGFGDSFVFISMIRLVNGWLPGPRATKYTQLFANIGQLGQIASAVIFAFFLNAGGWSFAFALASGFALIAALLSLIYLRDEPSFTPKLGGGAKAIVAQFLENIRDPFTRKAFWVHFTLQSSGSMFILLWGFPFLVQGEGISRELASALMSSFVFVGFLVGPLLSSLCIRFPDSRHFIVTGLFSLICLSWLLIIVTPGPNPLWQIVLLVLIIGCGGPASMIAFDYSRVAIPQDRLGSSNGIINSGGFVATFISMFLIGGALDLIHAVGLAGDTALYSLQAFKLAFPIEIIVLSVGIICFMRERRLTTKLKFRE